MTPPPDPKSRPCVLPPATTALPAAFLAPDATPRGPVRASRASRKRAIVLVAIHVAILVHLVHWRVAGVTVSPLEPSEAMYTLRDGVLNAGAILLVLSILSTLLVGRYFCGWGCHVVALQDASAWILKKLGVHPRPLKSRWLMLVPLVAGLYMFFWPSFMGWINGIAPPSLTLGLTKHDFWETFPGFWIGTLTFVVCGGAIVYVLGAKGFCTYACPYGGLFGVADRLATGRIRVTDACKQCGHCTAVCTSNVDVSREVLEYGMVVDPGCMKCRDCVSVCPESALYFGFGRPALFARARRALKRARSPQFSWREELGMALTFAVTLALFRGLPHVQIGAAIHFEWAAPLYSGQVPLLFALGLSAITAFAAVLFARALARPDASAFGAPLRAAGRFTAAGKVFVAATALWAAFLAHSAFVQYHTWKGLRLLERDEAMRTVVWWQNPDKMRAIGDADRDRFARGEAHLVTADRAAIHADPRIPTERSWAAMARGDLRSAAEFLDDAIRRAPGRASAYRDLAHVSLLLVETPRALRAIEAALAIDGDDLRALAMRVEAHVQAGDFPAALAAQRAVAAADASPIGRFRLATMLLDGPTPEDGVAELRALLAAHEGFAPAHAALALALEKTGRAADGAPHRARAEALQPGIFGAVPIGQ